MKHTADFDDRIFSAPSCQLCVVADEEPNKGMMLGSTSSWTMRVDHDQDKSGRDDGILLFQPSDIAPRTWMLDIRNDEHPIVYVDKTVPDAQIWVRNDPVFVTCVLPTIVQEVFGSILSDNNEPEQGWAKDWLGWADDLMPGRKPPWVDGPQQKKEWIRDLVDSFCSRHDLLERLVKQREGEVAT